MFHPEIFNKELILCKPTPAFNSIFEHNFKKMSSQSLKKHTHWQNYILKYSNLFHYFISFLSRTCLWIPIHKWRFSTENKNGLYMASSLFSCVWKELECLFLLSRFFSFGIILLGKFSTINIPSLRFSARNFNRILETQTWRSTDKRKWMHACSILTFLKCELLYTLSPI